MKITERMLEDWICENPKVLGNVTIIGRQVSLENGILDILAWDDSLRSVLVIELKATKIHEKHVGQTLRYLSDVKTVLSDFWHAHLDKLDEMQLLWSTELLSDVLRTYFLGIEDYLLVPHQGVLIGTSIDKKTWTAATGGSLQVRLWHIDSEGKLQISVARDLNNYEMDRPIPEWTHALWPFILETCKQIADYRFDKQIERLFTKPEV